MTLTPGQHVHIVGIGGTGMSAIAKVLIGQGYRVSGSDRSSNALSDALAQAGATIFTGHAASHVQGAEVLIATSAVPDEHVELVAAKQAGIPVYRRADIIAALMQGKVGIAVAGTHGKTTTTAMIVHILQHAGHDPSYIVGSTLRNTGSNAGVGNGPAFVIEADEYGHMFLGLRPQIAVITNIEWDHPDFFATPKHLENAFEQFAALLPPAGSLIGFADDPQVQALLRTRATAGQPIAPYGIDHPLAHWRASDLRYHQHKLLFTVHQHAQALGEVALQIPGEHNALNALAALAACTHQGVAFEDAAAALASFTGTARRFELRADLDGIAIVDDYAHHPTAIKTTIEGARYRYPEREVWAVWQPHTYSRTLQFWDAFMGAFGDAHHVIVTDVYAARESAPANFNAAALADGLQHADAHYAPTLADAVRVLREHVRAPATILIMSAGDAPQIGRDYLAILQGHA